MGNEQVKQEAAAPPTTQQDKPKLKICCACPETKKERDDCVIENGEDACQDLIERHKQCLRKEGFDV